MLLYIHGFNSSPQSHKASTLKSWMTQYHSEIAYEVPALRPYPAEAISQLEALVKRYLEKGERIGLVGSSLGGFYAAWLAEKYALRAVLVNPSVRPYDLLGRYLGENKNFYNDDRYLFEQKHVDELREYDVAGHQRPDRLLLMVQTGDESLDFKEATAKYSSSQNIIEYGGNHGFENFEHWFHYLLAFLHLIPDQAP